jgi:acyl carrier protein
METVEAQVRQFVIENFLFGRSDVTLSGDTSFLESRIIDSTGVLELVNFLETTYGIEVEEEEMDPANLDSLERIAAFVGKKRARG